ncbi:hypothetical protein ACIA7S_16075 [Streptomyces sp. NPDC051643]|uniref:hypothetical protein n=1 Tax=Streptomyces sp. NPDC051643 TaxID=3365665 RepID=UPI0037B5C379
MEPELSSRKRTRPGPLALRYRFRAVSIASAPAAPADWPGSAISPESGTRDESRACAPDGERKPSFPKTARPPPGSLPPLPCPSPLPPPGSVSQSWNDRTASSRAAPSASPPVQRTRTKSGARAGTSSGYSAIRSVRVVRSQPTPLTIRNSGTRAAVPRSVSASSGSVQSRSPAVGETGPVWSTLSSARLTSGVPVPYRPTVASNAESVYAGSGRRTPALPARRVSFCRRPVSESPVRSATEASAISCGTDSTTGEYAKGAASGSSET